MDPSELPNEQKETLTSWLKLAINNQGYNSSLEPVDIGNAFFLVGDFEKAASVYNTIVEKQPENGFSLMSQARVYRYLSLSTSNPEQAMAFDITALESAKTALSLNDKSRLPSATLTDPKLSSLIEEVEKLTSLSNDKQ